MCALGVGEGESSTLTPEMEEKDLGVEVCSLAAIYDLDMQI